jgi:hypothetical protein
VNKIYKLKLLDSEILELSESSYIPKDATLIVDNYQTSFGLFSLNNGIYQDHELHDKIIVDYYLFDENIYYLILRDKSFWEVFEDLIYDINYKLKKIPRSISNFIWNVKNIISWIPVLWSNFDWDCDFHLQLSIHKLKQMVKYFKNDAHVLDKNESVYYLKRACYFGELALNESDDLKLKQQYLDEYYEILKTHHVNIWD